MVMSHSMQEMRHPPQEGGRHSEPKTQPDHRPGRQHAAVHPQHHPLGPHQRPSNDHHHQRQVHRQHDHHHGHNHNHHQQPQHPQHHSTNPNAPPQKWHSFKMLVDPLIHRGALKMVRYDGSVVPGNPHHIPPTPSDPRKKLPSALWKRFEPMDLPVPKMRIDENYVGEPPKLEVTMENLNDNVDRHFLQRMVSKFGVVEDLQIYYHPLTRKHLGLARVIFETVKSAKDCVNNLHGKSVMGKQLNCFIDPLAVACKKMYQELTEEKRVEPPAEDIQQPVIGSEQPNENRGQLSPKGENNTAWQRRDRDPRTLDRHKQSSTHNRDRRRNDLDRDKSGGREIRPSVSSHRGEDDSSKLELASASPAYSSHPQTPHLSSVANSSQRVQLNNVSQDAQGPNYDDADYWMQKAQQFAAAAAAAAQRTASQDSVETPPAALEEYGNLQNSGGNVEVDRLKLGDDEAHQEAEHDSDEGHKVDLDTRLKLLMKDRSGAMPAFLLNELDELNGSDSESERQKEKAEGQPQSQLFPLLPDEVPLSRPPSPFLSAETYLASHRDWLAERRKEISAVQKQNGKGTSRRPISRNSDQMSLSSLSSAENILEQGVTGDGFNSSSYAAFFPTGFPHQGQWPTNESYGLASYHQYPSSMYDQYYHYGNYYNQSGLAPDRAVQPSNTAESIRPLVTESLNAFVKELKLTLRKDINKRICETFAFYQYEKWWQEQEDKYKQKMQKQQSKSGAFDGKTTAKADKPPSVDNRVEKVTKADDLNSLFDKQREKLESGTTKSGGGALGMGGVLGFGFRGTIPKLPSFKVKPRTRPEGRKVESAAHEDKKGSSKRISDKREKRREHERRREQRLEKRNEDARSKKQSRSTDKGTKVEASRRLSVNDTTTDEEIDASAEKVKKSKAVIESDTSGTDVPSKGRACTSSQKRRRRASTETSISSSSTSPVSDLSSQSLSSASSAEEKHVSKSPSSYTPSSSTSGESSSSEAESAAEALKKETGRRAQKERTAKAAPTSSSQESEVDVEQQTPDASSDDVTQSSQALASDAESRDERSKPVPQRRPSLVAKGNVSSTDKRDSSRAAEQSVVASVKQMALTGYSTSPHMLEHDYARPISEIAHEEGEDENQVHFRHQFQLDHGYTRPRTPPKVPPSLQAQRLLPQPKQQRQLPELLKLPPKTTFNPRSQKQEHEIVFRFLTKGLDLEDIGYLKRSYGKMLNQQQNQDLYWLNDTHWVDHTVTDIPDPPKKKARRHHQDDFSRPHLTGSCRTEGYYKMDPREKARTKYHLLRSDVDLFAQTKIGNMDGSATKGRLQTAQSLSREARSVQRRQLAVLGDEVINSDLLRFNQLKFRRKQMMFGKSAIHDWGLFALEDIGADEMVIEYVGHVIRPVISDVREKRYEKQGIGSSYLFRIDGENVVDATKRGNLARFINHSCDPNCYAKVITVDQQKKIVIYSKQPIAIGEEITYDYKFEIEDEKIRCLCGARNCRKYLN